VEWWRAITRELVSADVRYSLAVVAPIRETRLTIEVGAWWHGRVASVNTGRACWQVIAATRRIVQNRIPADVVGTCCWFEAKLRYAVTLMFVHMAIW